MLEETRSGGRVVAQRAGLWSAGKEPPHDMADRYHPYRCNECGAEGRDEIGNEIDRGEGVRRDDYGERFRVPRHARIACRQIESDGVPPDN